jgi:hypothetical protein
MNDYDYHTNTYAGFIRNRMRLLLGGGMDTGRVGFIGGGAGECEAVSLFRHPYPFPGSPKAFQWTVIPPYIPTGDHRTFQRTVIPDEPGAVVADERQERASYMTMRLLANHITSRESAIRLLSIINAHERKPYHGFANAVLRLYEIDENPERRALVSKRFHRFMEDLDVEHGIRLVRLMARNKIYVDYLRLAVDLKALHDGGDARKETIMAWNTGFSGNENEE